MSTRITVLGIDPGLTRCGYGVVTGRPSAPELRTCGVVRTPRDELPQRLAQLHASLIELIVEHQPDVVACEQVLFSNNARTAMATTQAAGIALLAAAQSNCEVARYTPTHVKLAVTGNGAADKADLAKMVGLQLGLDEPPAPADAADAVAVALCHFARYGVDSQIPAAVGVSGGATTWESVLATRNLRVVGGTPRPSNGGTPRPRQAGGGL